MKDFGEYYERYPEEVFYHNQFLDRIEAGEETFNKIDLEIKVLKNWLPIAVYNGHLGAVKTILDRLGVFNESGLTVKERLALYNLGVDKDDT